MEGCFLGNGDNMNFNSVPQFPTSDQTVWNIDEDAVLDELYGMLTAAEHKSYNTQPNHMPRFQDPNTKSNLTETSKLQHFEGYKPQFPLTSNHAVSMPVLPTHNPPIAFNEIPNSNSRQDFSVPQQPNSYQPVRGYPQNNNLHNQPPSNLAPSNLAPSNLVPSINIPVVEPVSSYAPTTETTLVTFVDLKTFYEKGQCRLQGKSEQRLDYASSFVRIYVENPDNIQAKSVFVERSPDAAHILKDNVGQVSLKILPDENDHWIKVNLDDAGSEVYKLSKVKGEERNLFRIGLKLLFKDTKKSKTFYSDPFQVKSKPKSMEGLCDIDGEKPMIKVEPELKKRAIKRSRNEEQELMMSSPLSIGSSVFPEVVTDHLEAATANIKQLRVNHPIQTPRGDIAYHFKLKDCPKHLTLEEGDLIGFFENPHDGKSEIRRLTCDNARFAKIAGVISRSAWLEGKTPGDDDKDATDVVCVIGVVKVKVRGPVFNGERIYASLSSYPGVAMPEHVITQVTSEDLTLIGQSLDSVKDDSPDNVNLVSCFVSILLSIQTQHTNKVLSDMRTDMLENVDSRISSAKKRLLRGLRWKLFVLAIFLALLGVLLYQVLAPLTAFRYWQCSWGSIPDSTSSFSFVAKDFQIPRVNGIEFHFDDLMDKLDANYKRKKNDSGHRYYLNIDRCAAGGLKHGVRGPKFYVLDGKCSVAHYYFDIGGDFVYSRYGSGRNFLCSFDDGCSSCGVEETSMCKHYEYMANITQNHFKREMQTQTKNQIQNETKSQMQNKNNRSKEAICLDGFAERRGCANFKYTSSTTWKAISVHGVEVTIEELEMKFNQTLNRPFDTKKARYYYNLRRCSEEAGGPQYFAVIQTCDKAYYYSDKWKKWKKYNSGKELRCSPDF